MRITLTLGVLLLLFSCGRDANEKTVAYLQTKNISVEDASVIIINPDYCGSCTQMTVDWLLKHDKTGHQKHKYILATAPIPEEFAVQLEGTSYRKIIVSPIKMQRLGYGGAISTHVVIKNGEITENTTIKELPG